MTLEPVDFQSHNAAEQFNRSLRKTGFGVLTNHPLSALQVQNLYQ